MHRFFVPPDLLRDRTLCGRERITLTGDLAHQLSRVLRLGPGDRILLLDNSGLAYEAELEHFEALGDRATVAATARLLRSFAPETEPRSRLILYQALPKADKMDWVLQKNTEIGVAAVAPLIAERCALQDARHLDARRFDRWRRIIQEAAEQSGRARLPELWPVQRLPEALAAGAAGAICLLGATEGQAPALRAVLEPLLPQKPSTICLFIGPEGGFSPDEVALAEAAGVRPFSLGPRILRSETAGLAAWVAILYALGEM
jgi:16S rRNA (uracil1498-N3)-methyltransferase